ncbi:hypothetical protein FXO38_06884 [Capsicum annuum]|nr:hypothetical protein FXO38_06884 [Capsicum annuum]
MVEESTVLDSLLLPKKIFCLAEPNRDEALAVDARQEIDLKVGVACTRFQTSYFNRKYGNLDARVIISIRVEFESGKEQFQCVEQLATVKGFTSIMPWLAISEKNLPEFALTFTVFGFAWKFRGTLGLLITAAKVQAGRRLISTPVGVSLIRGYPCIDSDLCLPDIRSFIEHQITLVAKGQADHSMIVQHLLEQFRRKSSYFVKQV